MIIALFPNESKKQSFDLAVGIQTYLTSQNIEVVAEDQFADQIGVKPMSAVDNTKIDFLISMGGDGTILSISRKYQHLEAAIIGINLGHLGFMADIPIPDIYPSLADLIKGDYTIQERLMLEGQGPDKTKFYAGNDFVIHRSQNHSLIELAIHVNGKFLNTFLADGIIIATPNGSTAYSLAAGGPILSPTLQAVVITPICPHTISNRPIVLNSDTEIQIQYLSAFEPVKVWADGIDNFPIETGQVVIIRKSARPFKLVNLHRHDYFSTLRTKLAWSGKLH